MDGRRIKKARESYSTMIEMVMPNDTNNLHNLLGGRLMHFMDIVAAISAQRHCNNIVVTASVDNVSFKRSIPLGDVVTLNAQVTRAFKTSMEVKVTVFGENIPNNQKYDSNDAFLTFVAVDENGLPVIVPELQPETEEEKALYDSALIRRDLRLKTAKK